MIEPVEVPAAVFATDPFWARLNRLADDQGHLDHPRILVGRVEPTSRYTLRCERCQSAVVELVVIRAAR
ncbi:hypothetical protein AB0B10_25600 [Micromonospora arborensis]|uniref:hypothetical protein n=1 Tax=Micromonospora arborensis TaxID=2116518 RepID=UPI00340A4333